MINFWHVLLSFCAGSMFSLTGVFLGAYMVYRTKREPHDSFMRFREPKGEAFNLADGLDMGEPEPPEIPSIISKMHNRFTEQTKETE